MTDLYAFMLIVIYIGFVVGLSFLFYSLKVFSSESTRKFIHILVSNAVFILAYKFTNIYLAVLGPLCFVFINYIVCKTKLSTMLGMTDGMRHLGLVYYPITLTILTLCTYTNIIDAQDMVAGILVMGYGDGLAALIGSKFGKIKIGKTSKSLEGLIVFILASCSVMLLFTSYPIYFVAIIALIAGIVELYSSNGFDNITVPLITAFLGVVLC